MSRSIRKAPLKAWIRYPRYKSAYVNEEISKEEMKDIEMVPKHPNRADHPPTDWDDLPLSVYRGQKWHYNYR